MVVVWTNPCTSVISQVYGEGSSICKYPQLHNVTMFTIFNDFHLPFLNDRCKLGLAGSVITGLWITRDMEGVSDNKGRGCEHVGGWQRKHSWMENNFPVFRKEHVPELSRPISPIVGSANRLNDLSPIDAPPSHYLNQWWLTNCQLDPEQQT